MKPSVQAYRNANHPNDHLAEACFTDCVCTTQSISVYLLAKLGNDVQSVDRIQASKHPSIQDCFSSSSRGFTANQLAETGFIECGTTMQSISVYPLAKMGNDFQSVDRSQKNLIINDSLIKN